MYFQNHILVAPFSSFELFHFQEPGLPVQQLDRYPACEFHEDLVCTVDLAAIRAPHDGLAHIGERALCFGLRPQYFQGIVPYVTDCSCNPPVKERHPRQPAVIFSQLPDLRLLYTPHEKVISSVSSQVWPLVFVPCADTFRFRFFEASELPFATVNSFQAQFSSEPVNVDRQVAFWLVP